jgi:hypothetical protein
VHEKKQKRKKVSLEMVQPWKENSKPCWSVSGVFGAED